MTCDEGRVVTAVKVERWKVGGEECGDLAGSRDRTQVGLVGETEALNASASTRAAWSGSPDEGRRTMGEL